MRSDLMEVEKLIYADHAATTRLDEDALQAMLPFLQSDFGNPSQPYSMSRRPRNALREARETIAHCIGAVPDEIFFTSGGTESDNWSIRGMASGTEERKELLVSSLEHHAVLAAADAAVNQGVFCRRIPSEPTGHIAPETLKEMLTDKTAGVSVMLVNNELGTIQPVHELCQLAHDAGALFHTDAVQAIGHIPVNVNEQGIDLLSASAHKFRGPRGVGFLYVRRGTRISPLLYGGAQERGMRAGTENVAGIVGMAVALEKACAGMDQENIRLISLANTLVDGLKEADIGFRQNGEPPFSPGIVSLSFPGKSGETLLHRLDLMGIAVSTGSACDGTKTEISHVLKAIGVEESFARGTIRISLGSENTKEDVRNIVRALVRITEGK